MTPLVGLTVFGYMFVIAVCLTLWAALTLRDGGRLRRAAPDERAQAAEPAPKRVSTGLPPQRTGERTHERVGDRPMWRAEERVAPRAEREPVRHNRVETVPLRAGLPEVAPPDPAEGTGRVRPVVDQVSREPRREPGRTVTAKKLVVSETTGAQPTERTRQPEPTPPSRTQIETTERRISNDDVRGAKAVVKQRSLDDAFDRFIEVDRKDRGF